MYNMVSHFTTKQEGKMKGDRESLENVLDFMIQLARKAGTIQMKHCGKAHVLDWTDLNNLKTKADRKVSGLIWKEIEMEYPEYSIYTEEKGAKLTGHRRMFVVDELDGTNPFVWGFSDHFSFCIALCEDNIPVFGVINAPKRRELYIGDTTRIAVCAVETHRPISRFIRVNAFSDLSKVWMGVDAGKTHRTSDIPFIEKAKSDGGLAGIVTGGCASVLLCLVAKGNLHAYLGTNLEPEDMAAAVPIIRGAGGKVTNLEGRDWKFGDRTILAANPVLHEKLFDFFGLPKTYEEVLNWKRQS